MPPFAAPPGWHWVYFASFRHWRSGKRIYARNYGRKAFALLVRSRRGA